MRNKVILLMILAAAVLFIFHRIGQDERKPAAPQAPAAGHAQVRTSDASNWVVTSQKDAIDDSPDVTAYLDSERTDQSDPLGRAAATLVVRCRQKKTDLYIKVPDRPQGSIDDDGYHQVALRLDAGKSWKERWSLSTDGYGLFAPYPIVLAQDIQNSGRMVFEYTPNDSAPVDVTFRVSGAARELAAVSNACHWPPWK